MYADLSDVEYIAQSEKVGNNFELRLMVSISPTCLWAAFTTVDPKSAK